MELSRIVVQLLVALVCASIANMLLPRQIPGKFLGFIVTGVLGVWLGELGFRILQTQIQLNVPLLHWGFAGVPIIPAIVGCIVAIYLITNLIHQQHSH